MANVHQAMGRLASSMELLALRMYNTREFYAKLIHRERQFARLFSNQRMKMLEQVLELEIDHYKECIDTWMTFFNPTADHEHLGVTDGMWDNLMVMTQQLDHLGMVNSLRGPATDHYGIYALGRDHDGCNAASAFRMLSVNAGMNFSMYRASAVVRNNLALGLYSKLAFDAMGQAFYRVFGQHLQVQVVKKKGNFRDVYGYTLPEGIGNQHRIATRTLLIAMSEELFKCYEKFSKSYCQDVLDPKKLRCSDMRSTNSSLCLLSHTIRHIHD